MEFSGVMSYDDNSTSIVKLETKRTECSFPHARHNVAGPRCVDDGGETAQTKVPTAAVLSGNAHQAGGEMLNRVKRLNLTLGVFSPRAGLASACALYWPYCTGGRNWVTVQSYISP